MIKFTEMDENVTLAAQLEEEKGGRSVIFLISNAVCTCCVLCLAASANLHLCIGLFAIRCLLYFDIA
jgi:hypothetical protein